MRSFTIVMALPLLVLSACGGDDAVLKCERGGTYVNAVETPRVRAPDDLDSLDALRELPLPEASPQEGRPANSGCLEAPPKAAEDG